MYTHIKRGRNGLSHEHEQCVVGVHGSEKYELKP